jgi:hypothetical protein
MTRHHQRRAGMTVIGARVTIAQRAAIERLAATHDRTPSREVQRAIRYYLGHPEAADEPSAEQAKGEPR